MSLCITERSKSKKEMEWQFEVSSLCMQLTKTQLFWYPVVVKRSIAKLHSTVSCYAEQSRIAHNILWHICMANVWWSCYVTISSFSWNPVLVCCFFFLFFFSLKHVAHRRFKMPWLIPKPSRCVTMSSNIDTLNDGQQQHRSHITWWLMTTTYEV